MATADNISKTAPSPRQLATPWKVLISVAILAHLTAVIAAPMAVPPSSQLQRDLAQAVSPYVALAYLNHGYRFFCPQPSPGHLVRYTLQLPDGSTTTDEFPNLHGQWPRLFYHRFFMLSEKLAGFLPPELEVDATPEDRDLAKQNQQTFDTIAKSYADHLLETTGAKRVTLELVEHELPSPTDMERDRPLTDKSLYKVLWTQSYRASTL
jgi:hypothetical protein